jgi:photosystem II stability/assembly factor-like uncharacterized protein
MKRLILILPSIVFSIFITTLFVTINSCSDNSGNVQNFSDFAGWRSAQSGVSSNLYALHFISADTGWAGGDNGVILFTSNGGESWLRQSTPSSLTIYSIHFIDRLNGWAAGGKLDNSNPYQSVVLQTTDAGETWKENYATTEAVVFNSIEFSDINNGWIVGITNMRNYVAKTTDGGSTWIRLANVQNDRAITSMDVMDSMNVYLAGDSLILASYDAADTWLPITPQNDTWITDIQFINQFTGYVCCWGGKFQRTNSSGLAWETVIVASGTDLYSISFTDEFNGWAAGNFGALYHTTNGGSGWGKLTSPFSARINKVFFFDKEHGWLVGDYGLIYYTRSGGI